MSARAEFFGRLSHEPSATSAAEAFDITGLLRRCMDDRELAAQLVDKFTDRLPETVKQIEDGIKAKNWSLVASKLHNLKGEAGSLAAVELADTAEQLRECLVACHLQAAGGHLLQLKTAADKCIQFRARIVERLGRLESVGLPC